MTERPDNRQPGEPVEDELITSDAPVGPQGAEADETGRQQTIAETAASPATKQGDVPVASGTSAAYTTGTLEPGELGPAVTKPAGEGPTQGEGPVQAVQDEDADEFRESRIDHEP